MLHLCRGQSLCERVGHHVLGGAIHKAQRALLDHPMDPVIVHVNVLGVSVILVVASEGDGGLVVRE